MDFFYKNILLLILTTFNISHEYAETPYVKTLKQWSYENDKYIFRAEVDASTICLNQEKGFIKFPSVIHSAQNLYINAKKVIIFGDDTFNNVRSFYGSPIVSCQIFHKNDIVEWEIISPTIFFSRFKTAPFYSLTKPIDNFFLETLNIVAGSSLFWLMIFCSYIFYKKIEKKVYVAILFSMLFFSAYFVLTVPSFFEINIKMLTAHKLADLGLWSGVFFLFYALAEKQVVNKKLTKYFLANILIALATIAYGKNGDQIQVGTSLPFIFSFVMLGNAFYRIIVNVKHNVSQNKLPILYSMSLLSFFIFATNDILVINGIYEGFLFLPLGSICCILFFALSVNEEIVKTFQERDHLRLNLEKEVENKTSELKNKNIELQETMSSLKFAQGELIQSSKLASLGTLAAGIAHEINNSLNYVNGSLRPLEKKIEQSNLKDDKKVHNLIFMMKDGLNLTFDIIKSLRNFTGLNKAKVNSTAVNDIIKNVLTILKSKIPENITLENFISPEVILLCSEVGLNQVFMNLIMNSVDAMPNGGKITINSEFIDSKIVQIIFKDTGQGMSPDVLNRIFDPFFTTKEVGKGTGLGMHLVHKEIEKHNGSINVESIVGKGTKFIINFPLECHENEKAAS